MMTLRPIFEYVNQCKIDTGAQDVPSDDDPFGRDALLHKPVNEGVDALHARLQPRLVVFVSRADGDRHEVHPRGHLHPTIARYGGLAEEGDEHKVMDGRKDVKRRKREEWRL